MRCACLKSAQRAIRRRAAEWRELAKQRELQGNHELAERHTIRADALRMAAHSLVFMADDCPHTRKRGKAR